MERFSNVLNIFKEQGAKGVFSRAAKKLYQSTEIVDLHDIYQNVYDYDPSDKFTPQPLDKDKKLTMNWFMITMGKSGGGDINIFRFINGFAKLGHKCNVYLVDNKKFKSNEALSEFIKTYFGEVNANFNISLDNVEDSDITVATHWKTAYYAHKIKNTKQKFYFVQDFEPNFTPPSSEYFFAEETYKMGFKGITAGFWLEELLHSRYGMTTKGYNFTIDSKKYYLRDDVSRNKKQIFFYARNITPRRCFELGVLALEKLYELDPEINVIMAGWNINNVKLRFPNENLGIKKENELVEIYNKCSMGVVLSATNCSLLPDELMACGCVPVTNKGNNNEWNVKDKLNGIVTELSPYSVAHTIKHYLDNENELQEIRKSGVEHVMSFNFDNEIKNIEEFIYHS